MQGAPIVGLYHRTRKDTLREKQVRVAGELWLKSADCTGMFIHINGINREDRESWEKSQQTV